MFELNNLDEGRDSVLPMKLSSQVMQSDDLSKNQKYIRLKLKIPSVRSHQAGAQ
jgi:hypothetical protein